MSLSVEEQLSSWRPMEEIGGAVDLLLQLRLRRVIGAPPVNRVHLQLGGVMRRRDGRIGPYLKAGYLASVGAKQYLHLSNHHSKIYTMEALDISAKLLEKNPECYTAWNYRKLAVQHNLPAVQSDSNFDSDAIKAILDLELKVVVDALKQNYKSYGVWHHRKWVLSKGHCSLDHELKLLKKFKNCSPRISDFVLN